MAEPGTGVLLERTFEYARISDCLRRARDEGTQVLLFEGEPGIGKSALAAATVQMAQRLGVRVLTARADDLTGRRPLGLLSDLLLDAAPHAPASPLSRQFTDIPGDGAHPSDSLFQAGEAVLDALDSLCAAGPVIVVLEDLHWADPASQFVLRHLLRHATYLPLAIVATLRPLPRSRELAALLGDLDASCRLTLPPLPEPAVRELAARVLCGLPGPRLMDQIRTASGNPLYVLELLDELRAEGVLERTQGPEDRQAVVEVARAVRIPSLRIAVLRRLSFLAPETTQLLRLAAVLGVRFRLRTLAALAGRRTADLMEPIGEALAAGVIIEAGQELSFHHELVQSALYDDLPQPLRISLHSEAAQILRAAGAETGVWVEHLLRGAEAGGPQAVSQLAEAAHGLAKTLPSASVELLERALSIAREDPGERAVLIADKALALLSIGRVAEGEVACRQALSLVSDPGLRGLLRTSLVESLLVRSDVESVLREIEASLLDPTLSVGSRAQLRGRAALARFFAGDRDGARADIKETGPAAKALGDTALQVFLLVVEALLVSQEGSGQAAAGIAARAVALAEGAPSRDVYEPVPHVTQAMALIDTDRFGEAAAVLARGRQAQEFFGARRHLAVHHVGLGFVHFWSGQWDDCSVEVETGISLAEETDSGWRAAARGLRAAVAAARGEVETAARWLREAESGLAAGEAPYRTEWTRWARILWLELAHPATAPEELLHVLLGEGSADCLARPLLATIGPTAARLALAAGCPEVAASVKAALRSLREANPACLGIEAAETAVGAMQVGDPGLFTGAADLYRKAGRPLESGLAAEEGAMGAVRRGDSATARELFTQALDAYRILGAVALSDRMARRLRRSGLSLRGISLEQDRPRDGWDSLTATERRILAMLVERRSNSEIARDFVISRRTVETHVSHILGKVGMRSRVELARAAADRFGWRLRLEGFSQPGEHQ